MAPTNDDPLRTADVEQGAPGVNAETATHVPGPGTEPLGTERGSASVAVPGYAIEGVLGRGGMGVVYKAQHLALKRTVALKMVLAGGHAGPRELARFRIEAEAAARLQHPNIVQIHEVGEADGHPYCALEFVEGGNLARKIAGTPLSAPEASRLVAALARAMQLAHSRNVVHRDLKPANILLAADGTPKISDFGLARQLDSDSGETQAGAVMGTPSYMAPEQASGRAHEAGPAADIYALGAILYDCLTGRPPFKGKTMVETLDQVRMQEPMPPSRWQKSVPLDLETICLKCLRKQPEQRYASAAELADELVRYQRGEPIRARPVGALERTAKWVRRRPAAAALMATVVLLLVGATTFSLLLAERERNTAAQLDSYNRSLLHEQQEKDVALKAVRVSAARMALEHGLTLCDQGDVSRGLVALSRALQAAVAADEADLESAVRFNLAAWQRQAWRLRAVLPGPPGTHVGAAGLSPDGTVLAAALANGTTQLWDAAEGTAGRVLHTLPHDGLVLGVTFSADGRLLLTRTRRTVYLWSVATGSPVCPPLGHEAPVLAAVLDPDGKRILTGEGEAGKRNGAARLWDAQTGRQLVQLVERQNPVSAVAFRPDGLWAVTAGSDGNVQRWKLPSGEADGATWKLKDWVTTVRFSPDGNRVLAGTHTGRIHMLEAATGKPCFPPLMHDGPIEEAVFGPDGTALAVRTALGPVNANVRLWDAVTGGRITAPLAHPGRVRCFAFHPDGHTLLTAGSGGSARFWDTSRGVAAGPPLYHRGEDVRAATFSRDGQTLMTLDGHVRLWQAPRGFQRGAPLVHPGGASAVTFSRDGKLALTGGQDGTARVWHTATAQPAAAPMRHGGSVLAVAFSPDGRLALTAGGGSRADAQPRIWDTATGQLRTVLSGHQGAVESVAVSPDGRTILTGSTDQTARLWDLATGRQLGEPLMHAGKVWAVAFSPNGQLALTGSADKTARLWRIATRQPIGEPLLHAHAVETVAFAADGQTAYTASRYGQGIRCWDTATGLARACLSGHQSGVWALAAAPVGNLVLSGSLDRTARFWSTDTGEKIGLPLQHQDTVRDVAFAPDGRTALTGSYDTTARRWHAPTGIPIGPALQHQEKIRAVALSADGRTAGTASWDGTARLWEAPPALPGTAEQLALWAQLATGIELDDGVAVRALDGAAWQERCREWDKQRERGVE